MYIYYYIYEYNTEGKWQPLSDSIMVFIMVATFALPITLLRELCVRRAAVLERMPVIDKSSPGHTNGESAGGTIKELEPTKLTHEIVFPQEPSNQVSDENDCNKLWYFSYLDI